MSAGTIATLATAVPFNDAYAANSIVMRAGDGSINVGQANVTGLAASAGLSLGKRAITAVATLDFTASLITVSATGGAFALTLPLAATSAGYVYLISKLDNANTVTLTGAGSDTIVSTAGSATTLALSTQYATTVLWCDGTRWWAK